MWFSLLIQSQKQSATLTYPLCHLHKSLRVFYFKSNLGVRKLQYFITGSPAAILIIGGSNNQTEVIDLATAGAESCVSSILEPHNSENAMGIMVGDKPTICGGWNWLGNPITGYDVCYSLDTTTGAWEQFESLPEIRLADLTVYLIDNKLTLLLF